VRTHVNTEHMLPSTQIRSRTFQMCLQPAMFPVICKDVDYQGRLQARDCWDDICITMLFLDKLADLSRSLSGCMSWSLQSEMWFLVISMKTNRYVDIAYLIKVHRDVTTPLNNELYWDCIKGEWVGGDINDR
jgi:hypothetical protein